MADKNKEHRSGGVRVKAGVLPGVRILPRRRLTLRKLRLRESSSRERRIRMRLTKLP